MGKKRLNPLSVLSPAGGYLGRSEPSPENKTTLREGVINLPPQLSDEQKQEIIRKAEDIYLLDNPFKKGIDEDTRQKVASLVQQVTQDQATKDIEKVRLQRLAALRSTGRQQYLNPPTSLFA